MATKTVQTHERGQSLTELAVMMTFLLVLLAGTVDLGRAFFTYITLRDAAQEGALCGSVGAEDCPDIDYRVRHSSKQNWVSLNDPGLVEVVDTLPADACAGDEVRVTVSYNDFPLTMPFLGALVGTQSVDISASVADTVLTPTCP